MEWERIAMPELDHDAFVEAFRTGNFDTMDAMHKEVDAAWGGLFEDVQSGKFHIAWWDCCHCERNSSFLRYALHHSTKQDGFLQLSCMEVRNGNITPLSDAQLEKVDSFLEHTGGKSGEVFVG